MNYNHCNKVHEYWRDKILPLLVHRHPCASFDGYLREFSFLPSGKWLRTMEKVKLLRTAFAVDPEKLLEKYKEHCVTYNCPVKPEDGIQRVIYQISPTLHFEAALWIWVEHDVVNSYASVFVCYNEEEEYLKFIDSIWDMRREGNTEEKQRLPGFFAATDSTALQGFTEKKEVLDKRGGIVSPL